MAKKQQRDEYEHRLSTNHIGATFRVDSWDFTSHYLLGSAPAGPNDPQHTGPDGRRQQRGLRCFHRKGVPERGCFQFVYSYSGETISPTIRLGRNGKAIASLGSLSAVQDDVLVDNLAAKGDKVTLFVSFGNREFTFDLHAGLSGHPAGFWAGSGYVTFYLYDPTNGSIVKEYGTMTFTFYHLPPWNGIEVTADPEKISVGEASVITLQPYETPDKPVIIPGQTYINLETTFLGALVGGLGLPGYGLRYRRGFVNAPWGLLRDTPITFEVRPDSLLPIQFDTLNVPVVAFSPYDTGVNGGTTIEVTREEEELEVEYINPQEIELWPTLGGGAYSGINKDKNHIKKEIIVEVTRNGEPVPNKEVVVTPRYIPGSGGHDHPGQPPYSLSGETIFQNVPITDSDGRVQFTYKAPKISGEYELIAHVAENGVIYEGKKKAIVRVPNLDPLVVSPYFEKVGAPDNNKTTNDPCRPKTTLTSKHFGNHYGTNKLNTAIRGISKTYYTKDDSTKLRINDISLKWGGFLDIDNNWKKPHWEHRIGKQADIGIKGIAKDGACEEELLVESLKKIFNNETDEKTYIHYENKKETQINHFHIRVK